MRLVQILTLVVFLSGCQLLPEYAFKTQSKASLALCPLSEKSAPDKQTCELAPWLEYWLSISELDWETRKASIAQLTPLTSDIDKLKTVLLSQANNTPYQTRLRAQRYASRLIQNQTQQMASFIQYVLYEPAQRELELESAIATLSRINADNNKQLQTQQAQIDEQARQIEKILQIEKSIVEKPMDNNP